MNKFFFLFIMLGSFSIANGQTQNDEKSLSLNKAIEISLNENPSVISAKKEIDAAAGKILQAGRLPNAEFSIAVNEIPGGFTFGDAGELDLSFSQPLEFFGKRGTRIQSAELQKTIAELNFERVKSFTVASVKKIYYSGLLSKQIIQSIESNITLLNDFLAQVTDRYQAGTSSYLDVLRAKVESARLRNELFDANRDYQRITAELKILLGKESDYEIELSDSLSYNYFETKKDSIVIHYSAKSSYLKINELQIEKSKTFLSLAEKGSLPDFNFGLAFQNRQTLPEKRFDKYLGLNLGISLPMFYSSGVRGDVQEAEANLSISNIQLHYAKTKVVQSILIAYSNLSFAEEQLRLFDLSLLKDLDDELKAGITAYQNSQIDVLNLFDIYRTYRATKVEYAKTVFNCLAALTELEVSGEVFDKQ